VLENRDTYGQAQVCNKGHQGSSVDRPCQPSFCWSQVLACMESVTSEYSTMPQFLSELLGRPGRVKCILNGLGFFGFWFLVCYAATQLATQLQQRRIQVACSNKVARKRLTESNGTPAMDFGCEEIRKRKYTQTKNRTKHTNLHDTIVI